MTQLAAVCIGECMVELTGTSLDDLASSDAGFGGDTLNTAAYLAACMGSSGSSRFVTALGNDPLSISMVNAWKALSIDVSGVIHLDGELPGIYAIENIAGGDRKFHYWRAQSAATSMASSQNLPKVLTSIADADLVYLSGISLAILPHNDRFELIDSLIQLAQSGTQVAFDLNYRPALWSAKDAYEAVDRLGPALSIALPSTEDDELMRKGLQESSSVCAVDYWRSLGVSEIVLKRGSEGVDICIGDDIETVKPNAIRKPVDTTAAGDSFNAAYLAGRLLGKSPAQAAAAGHELAGDVVMHSGAIVPSVLENRLK